MSCSRHCIHARPGVKFGDVSMEDTLLKVSWILGKVWRYIYIFTQGRLDTREGLEIYLLRVGWILEKVRRYIYSGLVRY